MSSGNPTNPLNAPEVAQNFRQITREQQVEFGLNILVKFDTFMSNMSDSMAKMSDSMDKTNESLAKIDAKISHISRGA
ncbi:hypothetical protein LY76DRAFT_510900 [Colletotrichum caudatum]|nr:hypothetical protein LY76DRAFT_510900 [Colletotrichum caudatum]